MKTDSNASVIVERALALEGDARQTFVREACVGDHDLQRRVEQMLRDADRSLVIDRPVGAVIAEVIGSRPAVVPGTQVGSYRIEAALGAGGMGEVYRATDSVLGRQVALKLLPEHVARDPERLARFRREARVLAALNHPHIGAIYGVETVSASGHSFALVLELVEGPTLADRLREGPLPVVEALPLARQIADALDAAHQQGIVHRDLKPANIKVRDDGTLKVLDFGLAKIVEPGAEAPSSLADSPTITTPAMTAAGILLGTAAYMSPEQAKGKPADKRTDIWAFGCVLYEMLTGKRAFPGEDVADTLSAVLRLEPDMRALPPDVPAAVRALLEDCLAKDRRERPGDVAAIVFALKRATSLTLSPAPARSTRGAVLAAVGTGLLAAGVAAAAVWWLMRPAPPRVQRWEIAGPGQTQLAVDPISRDLAVLPDGTGVVYKGGGDFGAARLYLRRNDATSAVLLTGDGTPRAPFASPDSDFVGFVDSAAPDLRRVAVSGGAATVLCRLDGQSRGAAWGDDDHIVFATDNAATGLQRVPSSGGQPQVLTRPDATQGEADHLWPDYLPGGGGVLFTITPLNGGSNRVALLDLRTREYRTLLQDGSQAQYTETGHLVYLAGGRLQAVPFDLGRGEVTGPSRPLLIDVAVLSAGTAEFDIARDGTLAYVPAAVGGMSERSQPVWIDRAGREQLIEDMPARTMIYPRLSADESRLALDVRDNQNDIWLWDFARRNLHRVTENPGLDRSPLWLPDGRLAFGTSSTATADGPLPAGLLIVDPSGLRPQQRIAVPGETILPTAVTADGTRILYSTNAGTHVDIMVADLPTGRIEPFEATPVSERNAAVSPDDRWVAFESNRSGEYQVYVRALDGPKGSGVLVSGSGGIQPLWSKDGRELFFLTTDGGFWAVPIIPGSNWRAGVPTRLFTSRAIITARAVMIGRMYDVSKSGRFLAVVPVERDPAGPQPHIVWVQNWFPELTRLASAR